jgi:transposase-like protein
MRYPEERKEAILKKMLPPNNLSIPELAQAEGISTATLYNWRKAARQQGRLLPDAHLQPEGWSSKDKFAAVLETAALNQVEIGEYCRKRGLYPEQLTAWREACEEANNWQQAHEKKYQQQLREQRRQTQELERELARKEKALAEAAALLILKKKAQILWEGVEGE